MIHKRFADPPRFVRVLLVLVIAAGIHACQQANEPNRTIAGVTVTAMVVDQAGRPVPDAFVRYDEGIHVPAPLSHFERTDLEGKARFVVNVPTTGSVYTFEIEPPANFVPQPLRRDSVTVPCQNSTIVFRVVRLANLPCGRDGSEMLDISLCIDQEPSRLAASALVPNSCPTSVSCVSQISPSLAAVQGLSIRNVDQNGASLGAVFTRTPGQSFQIQKSQQPGRRM